MFDQRRVNIISAMLLIIVGILDYFMPLGFISNILFITLFYAISRWLTHAGRKTYALLSIFLLTLTTFWSGEVWLVTLPATVALGWMASAASLLLMGFESGSIPRRLIYARLDRNIKHVERVVNTLPVVVWTANADGNVDYVSEAAQQLTGLSLHELMGAGWAKCMHPDDRFLIQSCWQKSVTTGNHFYMEMRVRDKQGSYIWYLSQAQSMQNSQGKVAKWVGSCVNISELKLLQTKQAIQVEKFHKTLHNMNEGFISVDHELVITDMNPRAFDLLRISQNNIINRPLKQCIAFLYCVLADKLKTSLALQTEKNLSFYHESADCWMDIQIVPMSDGALLFFKDISQQRQWQLQASRNHRIEAVGQLTGGVAHDFNNLLMVIMGNLDLLRKIILRDARELMPKVSRSLKLIEDAGERGSRLTKSLLAYSRRQNLDAELVEVGVLVKEIEDLMIASLRPKQQLFISQSSGEQWVKVDSGQLESALLNLVINARDAMGEDGRLHIHIRDELLKGLRKHANQIAPGFYVCIKVSDNGCGIPDEHLSRIFDPFFSTKDVGEGTGLGLSSMLGFIRQSGGDVQVESQVGYGTIFTLMLPKAETEADSLDKVTNIIELNSRQRQLILLVEDDPLVREYTVMTLEKCGYAVDAIADGDRAIEKLNTGVSYDLVFSDIVMPGKANGFDVAIHARRINPKQPVLLTSGFMDEELKCNDLSDNNMRSLAENVLIKPYQLEQLMVGIERALGDANS